ncbi:MAG: YihY/virulence factor BrkB family protein [Chitinophagales bacterium]|nr:YihY/virulence factor BrkB family protein [Chitinophagales bacterium]
MKQQIKHTIKDKVSPRLIEKLKSFSPIGFEGIPLYHVLQQFIEEIKKDNLSVRASSISFYFILAMFPSIIFLFSLIPYIPINNFDTSLFNFLAAIIPQNVFVVLQSTILDIVSVQRTGLVSINFFMAIFIATNAVNSIMQAFDKINPTFKKRNFIQKWLTSIKLLFLVNLQLIIAIVLIIEGKTLVTMLLKLLHTDAYIVSISLSIVKFLIIAFCFLNIFSLIYYYGPALKRKYKYFSIGATFATIISMITSYVFRIYTAYLNDFNRLYGSLGIIIVIMIWIYLNALVLLFGFELNNSIALKKLEMSSDKEN